MVKMTRRFRLLYGDFEAAKEDNAYSKTFTDYADFVNAVEHKDELNGKFPDAFKYLYVKKYFGKKYVYSSSRAWVEEGQLHAGRIDPKTFKEYRIETTVAHRMPTLDYLVNSAGIDVLLEFIKDNPEAGKLIKISK